MIYCATLPTKPKVCALANCNSYVYARRSQSYSIQYVWLMDVWRYISSNVGRNKFLFFYFSTGLGAAALQLGINYLQISEVVDNLLVLAFPFLT